MRVRALWAERLTSWLAVNGFPACLSPCHRPQRSVRLQDRADGQRQLAPPDDVGDVTEGADHRNPRSLFRIGEVMRLHGHSDAEDRRDDVGTEDRLVALVVRMRHERDARRDELRARRLDLYELAVRPRETDAMISARLLAILELGLRDGGTEIHVPQGRRLELIGEAAP